MICDLKDVQEQEDEVGYWNGCEVNGRRVAWPHSPLQPDTSRQRVSNESNCIPKRSYRSVDLKSHVTVNLHKSNETFKDKWHHIKTH